MAKPVSVILLVDDEGDLLVTLKGFLESTFPEAQVITARGGSQALEILRSQAVDLIMSDFKMPLMDGLQLLEAAAKIAPDVPRIMMTAFPEMDVAILALNQGRIQHFVTKPLEPAAVRDVVKALLGERQGRRWREAALARSLDQLQKRLPFSREPTL